jgi:hypothetical protein
MNYKNTVILDENDICSLLIAYIKKISKTYNDNPGAIIKLELLLKKEWREYIPSTFISEEETIYHEPEFNGFKYTIENNSILSSNELDQEETIKCLLRILFPNNIGEKFDYKISFEENYEDGFWILLSQTTYKNTQVFILNNL